MADRVLAVRAKTGAGKSAIMPVGIFRILRNEKSAQRYSGPSVLCTQPRVLTAKALAEGVASQRANPDMVLGQTCGYLTGPVQNAPVAGLLYATIGVLAAQLQHLEDVEIMARYRVLIVDEAHERSLDSDVTLCLLRDFYRRNLGNDRLPFLILASATFEPSRYTEYFGVGPENIVDIEGRGHPIRTHWPDRGCNDYIRAAAEQVLRIHGEGADDAPGQGDILVFLPGQTEMKGVVQHLETALETPAVARAPFLLLVLNREVVASQAGDYQLVFQAANRLPLVGGVRPTRRVILSTVVAETGITIDTLRYVVDCGWNRISEAYYPWGAQGLLTRPAPQSRVEQRKGRVGRLFPGDFYPLYTKNVHDALDPAQLPDIITQGPGGVYLALVRAQQRQKLRVGSHPEFRLEDLGLLDPPTADAFLYANSTAVALGFVSPRAPLPSRWPPAMLEEASPTEPAPGPALAPARGYGLTSLGHLAALFTRTPMEGVRVLLSGYLWRVAASDLITAVAMSAPQSLTVSDLLVDRRAKGPLPPDAPALFAALPDFLTSRWTGMEGGGPSTEEADWAARLGRPFRRSAARAGHLPDMGDVSKLPPLTSEHYYYRARLLLADTFIEAVLIFDAFAAQLEKVHESPLPQMTAWCLARGLKPEAMFGLAAKRSLVAEELALAGLNPYRLDDHRLSKLSARDFTDGVVRFKRCLYSGHRARLLRYDPAREGYYSEQGLRVKTPGLLAPSLFSRMRAIGATPEEFAPPRWIITDQLRFVAAARGEGGTAPLLYTVETGLVSVLDGYFALDPELGAPRAPSETAGLGPPADSGVASLPGRNDVVADAPGADAASAQLASYDQALLAAQEASGASMTPPQQLGDYVRAALFAPRQQELLINAPLGRAPVPCPGIADSPPLGEKVAPLGEKVAPLGEKVAPLGGN